MSGNVEQQRAAAALEVLAAYKEWLRLARKTKSILHAMMAAGQQFKTDREDYNLVMSKLGGEAKFWKIVSDNKKLLDKVGEDLTGLTEVEKKTTKSIVGFHFQANRAHARCVQSDKMMSSLLRTGTKVRIKEKNARIAYESARTDFLAAGGDEIGLKALRQNAKKSYRAAFAPLPRV